MNEVTACQEAAQIVCREYFSSVDMALRSYNTYLKKRGAEQATLTQINRYLQSADAQYQYGGPKYFQRWIRECLHKRAQLKNTVHSYFD